MSACSVCGSTDARPFHPGLLRCPACGHGWADLQLSPDELAALYRRDYFFGDEYLGAIFDEVKARPHYIVEERVNFPPRPGAPA